MRCDMCGSKINIQKHFILYIDWVSEEGQDTSDRLYLCESCYAILRSFISGQFWANMEKQIAGKKEKTVTPTVTDKQSKYVEQLSKRLADIENKSLEEIGQELYQKFGKKLPEMNITEASQVIEYLKDRLNKAKKKGSKKQMGGK